MESGAYLLELPLLPQPRHVAASTTSNDAQTNRVNLRNKVNNDNDHEGSAPRDLTIKRETSIAEQAAGKQAQISGWTTTWLLESISYVAASAAMLAVVVTLKVNEGKPLQHWPKLISINALISIFSTLLKTMLVIPITEGTHELKWLWYSSPRLLADFPLFESAANGPFGAFTFLLSLRFMRSPLGLLGASIMILSLATEPFIQQMLHYHDCLELSDTGQASVSRISTYDEGGFHTGSGFASLNAPMQTVLYRAAIAPSPNASSDVDFICSSGNCTFPINEDTEAAYSSLGMCSSVMDISDQIINGGRFSNSTPRTISLPSGLNITDQGRLFQMKTVYPEDDLGVYRPIWNGEALMFSCPNATIVDGIARDCGDFHSWAFRASLFPCVRQYGNVSISDFKLQEQIMETLAVPMMNFSCDRIGPCGSLVGNLSASYNTSCEPTTYPTEINTYAATQYWPGAPRWLALDNQTDVLYYPEECVWRIDGAATGAIMEFLPSLFGASDDPLDVGNFYGDISYSTYGPIWLQRMYSSGTADITSVGLWMSDIANAMTAQMRRDGGGAYAKGSVYGLQTCIGVRWGWVVLPATLLAMTFVFFTLVVVKSHRGRNRHDIRREVWKSNPMPMIWNGLEDKVKDDRLGDASRVRDMKAATKDLRVRLTRTGGDQSKGSDRIALRES